MGGLFGLGGTLGGGLMQGIGNAGGIGAFFSDRRLKKDIEYAGTRSDGLPVYFWKYLWGGPTRLGPMADDVRKIYPDAVMDIGGYLAIDPAKVP
jgi:hypothetical protein